MMVLHNNHVVLLDLKGELVCRGERSVFQILSVGVDVNAAPENGINVKGEITISADVNDSETSRQIHQQDRLLLVRGEGVKEDRTSMLGKLWL